MTPIIHACNNIESSKSSFQGSNQIVLSVITAGEFPDT